MKKHILYLLYVINPAFAQNWANAGLSSSLNINHISSICPDTINGKIYVANINWTTSSGGFGLGIYDNNTRNWAIKDTFNNTINSLVIYNGELYAGGTFKWVDSIYTSALAKWNGITWVNIADSVLLSGNLGYIGNMKVYNNELYVMGSFDKIGGIHANSIAKWNGTTWSDINGFPDWNSPGWEISDFSFYNGDLYIGGNFITNTGLSDIAVYKNNLWQKVGTTDTLRGGWCAVAALEVYKSELYAGGTIWHTEGNVGHGIQKWNGTSWSAVGTGVQDNNNITNNGTVQFFKLQARKGKLYGNGTFTYAGNVIAPRVATWDGNNWCAIDRNIDQNISTFNFFNDSLYAATSSFIEGIFVNFLAKFNGNYLQSDTCSIAFNSINQIVENNSFSIYPNPTPDFINLEFNGPVSKETVITVKTTLGQTVAALFFNKKIDVSYLSAGCYFLSFSAGKKIYNCKFLKQ